MNTSRRNLRRQFTQYFGVAYFPIFITVLILVAPTSTFLIQENCESILTSSFDTNLEFEAQQNEGWTNSSGTNWAWQYVDSTDELPPTYSIPEATGVWIFNGSSTEDIQETFLTAYFQNYASIDNHVFNFTLTYYSTIASYLENVYLDIDGDLEIEAEIPVSSTKWSTVVFGAKSKFGFPVPGNVPRIRIPISIDPEEFFLLDQVTSHVESCTQISTSTSHSTTSEGSTYTMSTTEAVPSTGSESSASNFPTTETLPSTSIETSQATSSPTNSPTTETSTSSYLPTTSNSPTVETSTSDSTTTTETSTSSSPTTETSTSNSPTTETSTSYLPTTSDSPTVQETSTSDSTTSESSNTSNSPTTETSSESGTSNLPTTEASTSNSPTTETSTSNPPTSTTSHPTTTELPSVSNTATATTPPQTEWPSTTGFSSERTSAPDTDTTYSTETQRAASNDLEIYEYILYVGIPVFIVLSIIGTTAVVTLKGKVKSKLDSQSLVRYVDDDKMFYETSAAHSQGFQTSPQARPAVALANRSDVTGIAPQPIQQLSSIPRPRLRRLN